MHHDSMPRLLAATLRLNAAFCVLGGILAVVYAQELAMRLWVPYRAVVIVGIVIAAYGAFGGAVSATRRSPVVWGIIVTALDLMWILCSIAFLAMHETPESWIVLAVGGGVLAFAIVQIVALCGCALRGHTK